ncbi:MAG: 30S ribosomal protein S2, partial [Candidatus Sericytochromatia bacterium]|nr:30S ribosomal protein S2 [Candidatus Sericytochromatia bacterium]
MAVVPVQQLLESGVHFGHQTKKWNPKMRKYIFGERKGIYIINLQETSKGLDKAYEFIKNMVSEGRNILFVGTKKQAQEAIQDEAVRCGMYFVNQRWLGGMLTNFSTIKARIVYLKDLEAKKASGYFENLNKKEVASIEKEITKLTKSLGGIKDMTRLPDVLFIVDTQKEHLAVKEARKLNIPVVAIVDTNCNPDDVDFVIPGNDDAIKAVKLLTSKIA